MGKAAVFKAVFNVFDKIFMVRNFLRVDDDFILEERQKISTSQLKEKRDEG